MLCNNLDPDAENLGGIGGVYNVAVPRVTGKPLITSSPALKRSKTTRAFGTIRQTCGRDQSHPDAPGRSHRELYLVGKWANWEHFDELEKEVDDVRPNDGGFMDYRNARHHPRDL